ncbi:RICIN domain-containing protein [Streptosporangium sp. NPDC048047]|uniref:RICIN domain-containing protein n=1 Tax=Streptosporangium sp. NPDC048047 TaxID=3155748 RepID=UPI0034153FC1
MGHSRPAVRTATRGATVLVAAALAAGLFPGVAHADGTYRWQNQFTRQYLDVYKKSKANGGIVVSWPSTGSKSQLWKETKSSAGYYRVRNVNSGKSMDRWNRRFSPSYNGAACDVTQWSWWGGNQQHWKRRSVWSKGYNRRFFIWYNWQGCLNDRWHDTLGVLNPFKYSNIILYSRSYCTEGKWIGKGECYWRKNGK